MREKAVESDYGEEQDKADGKWKGLIPMGVRKKNEIVAAVSLFQWGWRHAGGCEKENEWGIDTLACIENICNVKSENLGVNMKLYKTVVVYVTTHRSEIWGKKGQERRYLDVM